MKKDIHIIISTIIGIIVLILLMLSEHANILLIYWIIPIFVIAEYYIKKNMPKSKRRKTHG